MAVSRELELSLNKRYLVPALSSELDKSYMESEKLTSIEKKQFMKEHSIK